MFAEVMFTYVSAIDKKIPENLVMVSRWLNIDLVQRCNHDPLQTAKMENNLCCKALHLKYL